MKKILAKAQKPFSGTVRYFGRIEKNGREPFYKMAVDLDAPVKVGRYSFDSLDVVIYRDHLDVAAELNGFSLSRNAKGQLAWIQDPSLPVVRRGAVISTTDAVSLVASSNVHKGKPIRNCEGYPRRPGMFQVETLPDLPPMFGQQEDGEALPDLPAQPDAV